MINIPFIAGVIDCRGHIYINERHTGFPQPGVRVTTKREGILQHLAQATGSRTVLDTREYVRRPCLDHCDESHQHVNRQSAIWTCGAGKATIILYNIKPYVVSQTDKVNEALEVGLLAWATVRANTVEAMRRLGWSIPNEE